MVGFAFEGIVGGTDFGSVRGLGCDGGFFAGTLLDDVSDLVGQEMAPGIAGRRVHAGGEIDVAAGRVGEGIEAGGGLGGFRAGVDANITLEVRVSNAPAIALYESYGFRGVGTRRRYYSDTGEDAIIMWRAVGAPWETP